MAKFVEKQKKEEIKSITLEFTEEEFGTLMSALVYARKQDLTEVSKKLMLRHLTRPEDVQALFSMLRRIQNECNFFEDEN